MFDARDWCWIGEDGRVYLSAVQAIVRDDDAAYEAWRAAHGPPTPWPRDAAGRQTVEALQEVLTRWGLWIDLRAYAADARWRAETAGIVVDGMAVPTDRASQGMISGMLAYAQIAPDATVQFKGAGGFVTLDAAAISTLARAVAAHVQRCFAREAHVRARIASGEIATIAGVDAAFAGDAA